MTRAFAAALLLASACTVRGVVGVVAENGDVVTALPRLPTLGVTTVRTNGSVAVTLAPVEGAKDYRIYVLPRDEDVSTDAEGHVTVRDAIYRCAGDREAPAIPTDGQMQVQSGAIDSVVVGDVEGYARGAADALLGYVFTSAGEGRAPVYALAESSEDADNTCYFHRYSASRIARYTTSGTERETLLAAGYRDDGIAFYVPAASAFDTRTLYATTRGDSPLFVTSGPEHDAFVPDVETPLFEVLAAETVGAVPLMRLHYVNACGRDHDVLAVSRARFAQLQQQGRYALPHLHYAGLRAPTTLVVEALDAGCPFRGHLSPEHRDAFAGDGTNVARQAWLTLDELAQGTPTGEVFVNGQHAAENRPRAIARSFVRFVPEEPSRFDWHETFDDPLETPESVAFSFVPGGQPYDHRYAFERFDATLYSIAGDAHAMGVFLGELWVSHGDAFSQTQSKLRLTPRTTAVLADDAFVHARMRVDLVTTDRRFPQILVSDRPIPVHESLAQGFAIIAQVAGSWPAAVQLAFCDNVDWDASNNCPFRDLTYRPDGTFSPTVPPAELAGVDRVVELEVYASTRRVYALLGGMPYGCMALPPGRIAPGVATVTFGDVLFHSGIDVDGEVLGQRVYAFHHDHMKLETRRHFDDLAFSSGVQAPTWDEARIPCFAMP